MDNMCEQKIKIAEVFYHAIQFELTMPGTLLSSNASLSTNNIMVWKIDWSPPSDWKLCTYRRITSYQLLGIRAYLTNHSGNFGNLYKIIQEQITKKAFRQLSECFFIRIDILLLSLLSDSNQRPRDYKSRALAN